MNLDLINRCAKALWDKSQADLANQYKYRCIAKSKGPISWEDLNDIDIIPSVANEYREFAKVIIREVRKHVASRAKDNEDMLSIFMTDTSNGE